ncbi:acyl carrier protein [Paenibacillus phyllosphaerae]|uniref:Acyl carrier protein n=1 Tax=Paenibacillus phyllosphaerae TaxID=274593 RepID=A0A7W5FR61_9BACL|nr:acyl carrier protein [Paenibacillus phyllosphaerae]MBB3114191.1 acyl carrier protein [Paenibacillus phyllosphaerae]
MEQQIIALISQIKDDAELTATLNGDSNIMTDGGLDSLQLINFILKVEEQFGVEIDFEAFDFSYMESVHAFCRYISDMQETASV